MHKLILSISISLIGFSAFASPISHGVEKDGVKLKEPITTEEKSIIKDNVNAALKLLLIEQLCSKETDKISYIYANSLIYSSAFVKPKVFDMDFAKKIEDNTIKNILEIQKNGEGCILSNPEDLNTFRREINARVVNSFYNSFSDEKSLIKDVKENSDKSIYEMLEKKFFSNKSTITTKDPTDNKVALLNNYVNAVVGYKNLKSCYKTLNMTNDSYKKAQKNWGKFLIDVANGLEVPTIEKITIVTTGFVVADTLHKNSCGHTKITMDLYEKLNITHDDKK